MFNFTENYLMILIAVAIDIFFGDPRFIYHPVRIIGWFVKKWEDYLNKKIKNKKIGGVILWFVIVLGVFISLELFLKATYHLYYIWGIYLEILIIYFSLAGKSLIQSGFRVFYYLTLKDIPLARQNVQMIVSRDMSQATEQEIIRATLESLSENLSDGVIAPLFYALIGGAPLAFVYKAVNTLDSMIGYKNKKYINFGWFSAKMDDIFNYLPARITGLLLILSSMMFFQYPKLAIKAWKKDSQKGDSPNGGIPIVVYAGATNIILGGNCRLPNGKIIKIPHVGGSRQKLQLSDIIQIIFYTINSVVIFLILCFLLFYILHLKLNNIII